MELDVSLPIVSRYLQHNASTDERQEVIRTLCQLLQEGGTTILNVDWLVSEDDNKRMLGTQMLAEVVQQAGPSLNSNDLHHLALFMAARLTDWPSTEPAARGCLALLELKTGPHALLDSASQATQTHSSSVDSIQQPAGSHAFKLADADGVAIMKAAAEQLAGHVQQLPQKDRAASLQLLLQGTQLWGVHAAQQGVNLVEACVAAIDGEKDPRCLLAAFNLVQAVACVYHARGVDAAAWQSQAEEVVEVLSCYFPLTFNPPKGDPHKISREQLLTSLLASLSCSPFLSQWVIPLVLEKLSSTYRPAKEDALAALVVCFQRYGKEALKPHLKPVWSALRCEMLAPSAFGLVSGEGLSNARELASKAAECATQCCAALGVGQLEDVACRDEQVGAALLQLVSSAAGTGSGANIAEGSDLQRGDRQLLCLSSAVGAVAASGDFAAQRLCQSVLVPLLGLLPPHQHPNAADSADRANPVSVQDMEGAARWASIRTMYILSAAWQAIQRITGRASTESSSDGKAGCSVRAQLLQQSLLHAVQPFVQGALQAAVHAVAVIHQTITTFNVPTAGHDARQQDAAGVSAVEHDTAVQVLLTCCSYLEAIISLQEHSSISSGNGSSQSAMQLITASEVQAVVQHMLQLAVVAGGEESNDVALQLLSQRTKHRMAWGKQHAVNDAAIAVVMCALKLTYTQSPACKAPDMVAGSSNQQQHGAHLPALKADTCSDLHTYIASKLCSQLQLHLASGSRQSAVVDDSAASSVVPVSSSALQHTAHVCRMVASAHPAAASAMLCALCPLINQHLPDLLCSRRANDPDSATPTELTKELLHLLGTCLSAAPLPFLDTTTTGAMQQLITSLLDLDNAFDATSQYVSAPALAAAAVAAGHLTACLPTSIQSDFAKVAAEILTREAAGAHATKQLMVFAVLAALQPGAVTTQQALELIHCLQQMGAALATPTDAVTRKAMMVDVHDASSSSGAATLSMASQLLQRQARAQAVALASLLLKLPDDMQLQQCAQQLLDAMQGLSTGDGTVQAVDAWQMESLPWIVTALARRNSPLATAVVQKLMHELSQQPAQSLGSGTEQFGGVNAGIASPAVQSATQEDVEMQDVSQPEPVHTLLQVSNANLAANSGVQTALLVCQMLRVLFASDMLSNSNASAHVPYEQLTWWHAKGRLLWQQRAVAVCCSMLVEHVREQPAHQGLHCALACLLSSTSWLQLRQHWPQLASLLVPNLTALLQLCTQLSSAGKTAKQQGGVESDSQAVERLLIVARSGLLGLLQVLLAVIKEPRLAALLEGDLVQLLPLIAATCTLKGNAAVREAGLHVLCTAQECLPYHLLHPQRSQVLRAVNTALDDDKRSVRQLAVKCRRLWTSQ